MKNKINFRKIALISLIVFSILMAVYISYDKYSEYRNEIYQQGAIDLKSAIWETVMKERAVQINNGTSYMILVPYVPEVGE